VYCILDFMVNKSHWACVFIVYLYLCCRVVKAAAAGEDGSSQVEMRLMSDSLLCGEPDSVTDPQPVPNVSCPTTDSAGDVMVERQCVEGMEEPKGSVDTWSADRGDLSPLQADLENGSPTMDDCEATPVASLSEVSPVDTLAEDEPGTETDAVDNSTSVDVDAAEDMKLSTAVPDGDQYYNHLSSSCNELSSSLTDSLDICEQGLIGDPDCGLVSAADSETDFAADSVERCTPCQCSSNSSDDHVMDSPTTPEDDESSQCDCDDNESDRSLGEAGTCQPLSESSRQLSSLEQPPVDYEKDWVLSIISETSTQTSSDAAPADITLSPSVNTDDHDSPALSSSLTDVSQITPGVEMETENEAGIASSSVVDGTGILSEPDCEPGGKASKLDQPSSTDHSTGDDLESSDTGVLHMSVGFQTSPCSDRVATFNGDSRDTSIGVLMVCDDDGVVSSVSTEPSSVVSSGFVVSPSREDYNSVITDNSVVDETPLSFAARLSGEADTEKRPLDVGVMASGQVDIVNSTESLEAVAVEDVMLCEVESKSREMDELLADVSQTVVNSSHGAQSSDTSIFSHEDSEL